MKHFEDYFVGVNNLNIYYQVWRPNIKPKAVIQFIHGILEHSGRYPHLIEKLVSHGYIVFASDLRGHGKSEGVRSYVQNFDYFVEDQKFFFDLIKKKEPNLPIFLHGYSFGSSISVIFAIKYTDGLNGLILASAGTDAGNSTNFLLRAITAFMALILPKKKIDPKLIPTDLSRDLAVVKAYENDPLISKKTTVKLGAEFLKGLKKAINKAKHIKYPTLIQCGSADKIAPGYENLEKLFTTKDKTIKIYDGLYHDIYNELEFDRTRVLNDLIDWLELHL